MSDPNNTFTGKKVNQTYQSLLHMNLGPYTIGSDLASVYDGAGNQSPIQISLTQVSLGDTVFNDKDINLSTTTTPSTPVTGLKIYCKSDNKVYTLDSLGVETELGSGGTGLPPDGTYNDIIVSGSGLVWTLDSSVLSPYALTSSISDVGLSGQYVDILGTPDLSVYATISSLGAVAFSNDYGDLDNLPSISAVGLSGQYSDLIGAPSLSTVAISGDYDDLINKPDLSVYATIISLDDVAFSGDYNDLSNTPSLATVATTGDYDDLINLPTLGTMAAEDVATFTGSSSITTIGTITSGTVPYANTTGVQQQDSTLTALASYNTNGFLVQTAADTFTGRSFADSTYITWANPAGAAGNPTASFTGPLALADGGLGTSLSDPGADRITFWDDSEGAVDWLEIGSGLSITGTVLSATGGGGGLPPDDDYGDITVSGSGTIWTVDSDVLAPYALTSSLASIATSGLYSDLQSIPDAIGAIDSLSPTADSISYYTGTNTASLTDLTAFGRSLLDDMDASSARTTLGLVIGTDVQAHDATLDSLAAYNTNGILTQTATDTFTGRTLTGTANQIIVTNGSGVSGNPTFSLPYQTDIPASSLGPSELRLYEDTDNGTNKVTIISPSSITSDATLTLQATTGTVYSSGGTDVSIADGGTGASTQTAAFNALSPLTTIGDIIYHNGTNNVRLAAGSNGQVLTLASGVPSWGSGGSGSMVLLATRSASNSATINFDNLLSSSYNVYKVIIHNLVNATNTQTFRMLVGTGSTPTYQTSNYTGRAATLSSSYGQVATNSARIDFGNTQDNGHPAYFEVTISNVNAGTETNITSSGAYFTGSTAIRQEGLFWWTSSTAVTSLQFFYASGNISTGQFYLYGINNT